MSGIPWLILTLALVAAVFVKGWKRFARRKRSLGPGTSVETAYRVRSFREIDDTIAGSRCECGYELVTLGEATRSVKNRDLRVLRVRCRNCDDETQVFFDLSQMYH